MGLKGPNVDRCLWYISPYAVGNKRSFTFGIIDDLEGPLSPSANEARGVVSVC